jgi:hypothetical protein
MSNQIEKGNVSLFYQKLALMKRKSEEFYRNYLQPFTFSENFNILRLYALNKLDEIVKTFLLTFSVRNLNWTKESSRLS